MLLADGVVLASGHGAGSAALPATGGNVHLPVYGAPRDAIGITLA